MTELQGFTFDNKSFDRAFKTFESAQNEMKSVWQRHVEVCSEYFSELTKARGPADIIMAQGNLLTSSIDDMGDAALVFTRLSGGPTDKPTQ